MKRTVIGLVGPIACGKGFLSDYLVRNGFYHLSLSDRVREEVDRRGLERTRETLQNIGNELREVEGASILAKLTAAMVPDDEALVVIEGIRNPMEVDYLKAVLGATIIGVEASIEFRLARYLERAVLRGEDGITEDDFFRANRRDQGEGEDMFGQQGRMCFEMADVKVFNDGTDQFLRESVMHLRELGIEIEGMNGEIERK